MPPLHGGSHRFDSCSAHCMSYEDTYRLSSHAVITNADGEVLLLYANYNNGFWGLPGGAVDPGETVVQTLRRECLEELGCDINIKYLSGAYYHKKHNSHVFVFRVELDVSNIKLSDEHSEFKFFDLKDMSATQRRRVEDCLNFNGEVQTAAFE